MKKILNISIICIFAFVFVSCDNDFSNSNRATDTGYLNNQQKLAAISNNIGANNFNLNSSNYVSETINETTSDVIELVFENGLVDDTTDNLANITIYPLSDAADNDSLFVRGTAVTFTTTTVTYDGDETTIKFITTDSGLTDNTAYEIVINPELTAYNSAIKFNQDGDVLAGEANDDQYSAYVSKGAPTLATGRTRNNPSTNGITISAITFPTTLTAEVTFAVGGSTFSTPLTTITGAIIDSSLTVEKFSYDDLTWNAVTNYTTSYVNTTGVYTITVAKVNGEKYRYTFDEKLIKQDESKLAPGEAYLSLNNQYEAVSYTTAEDTNYEATAGVYYSGATVSSTISNVEGNKYVDLDFTLPAGHNINADTLTSDSVKFIYNDGTHDFNINYTGNIEEIADNKFKFRFNTALDISGITGTVYQTVTEDNGTDDTSDDTHIANETF